MLGVTVNALAILAGTLLGYVFKRMLKKNVQDVIMQAMGISVVSIGINLLKIKKIRTADMLPAILGCLVMIWL